MKIFLRNLFLAFGGVLAIQIKDYLILQKLPDSIAIILGAICAFVVVKLLEALFIIYPFHFRIIRKFFDPNSMFEGFWIQTVRNGNVTYYTLIDISFDKKTSLYAMVAETYYGSGDEFASLYCHWHSTSVLIDTLGLKLEYSYSARLLNSDNGETINGYGDMMLHKSPNDKFKCTRGGSGNFTDHGTKPVTASFRFEEVPKSIMRDKNKDSSFLKSRMQLIKDYNIYYLENKQEV